MNSRTPCMLCNTRGVLVGAHCWCFTHCSHDFMWCFQQFPYLDCFCLGDYLHAAAGDVRHADLWLIGGDWAAATGEPQLRWLKGKAAENMRSIICHCEPSGLQFFVKLQSTAGCSSTCWKRRSPAIFAMLWVRLTDSSLLLEVNSWAILCLLPAESSDNRIWRKDWRKLKSSLLFGWTNR